MQSPTHNEVSPVTYALNGVQGSTMTTHTASNDHEVVVVRVRRGGSVAVFASGQHLEV